MNRVLSDHRFLHTSPGFSARGLLERINSPRLADMPELANWIEAAADDAGVSAELMCVIPQKEQSGLTEPKIRPFGLRAFCGYGVTRPGEEPREEWSGPEKQIRAAASRLRMLFLDALHSGGSNWIARVGELFGPAGVTPANAATAALYSYTPSKHDKANILRIWTEFGFGDPLANEDPTMQSRRFVAPIQGFATNRVNRTLHGRSVYRPGTVPGHDVFKGYNSPGTGDGLDSFAPSGTPVVAICDGTITRWYNDASKREVIYLEAPGVVAVYAHIDYLPRPERIPRQVKRGEVIGVVRGELNDPHLHFEWWLDGKALSHISPLGLRDLMVAASCTLEPELKIVGPDDKVIECNPQWSGDSIVGEIRALVEALGFDAFYRTPEQGPRVYIKRKDLTPEG